MDQLILERDPGVTVDMLKAYLRASNVRVRGRVQKERLYKLAARVAQENIDWSPPVEREAQVAAI